MQSTKSKDLIGHIKFCRGDMQHDQTLPLSAKGVTCKTRLGIPLAQTTT